VDLAVRDDIEQARASGIMRFPAPHDRYGHWCLPSHHPQSQPPSSSSPTPTPLQETEAPHLLAYLATISDPRGRRGRRHPLVAILAIAAAAVLAGARSMAAIAEWAADVPQLVRVALGARRDAPAH
jgi:hypothetical protein